MGAPRHPNVRLRDVALGLMVVLGCGSDPTEEHTGTTESQTTTMDSGMFVGQPDGGAGPPICEFLAPDCPPGNKCVGYDMDDDGTPDETQCVPAVADGGSPGDPCTWMPSTGEDDCATGLTCFDAQDGNGLCVPNCVTEGGAPQCDDPDRRCFAGGGPVQVCLSACDPREGSAACPDPGDACYPNSDGDWLLCVPDASGQDGVVGDPCTFVNGCNPGAACTPAAELSACDAAQCCSALCTVGDDAPCSTGDTCTPWFPEGAPAGLTDLGLCRVTSR